MSIVIVYYIIVLFIQIMESETTCVGKFINTVKDNGKQIFVRRMIFRVFITLIVVAFAFLIPRFAIALNLFGSISGASLQFCFPLFAYYAAFKDTTSAGKKAFNFFILLIGLTGCGFGIYGSLAELL